VRGDRKAAAAARQQRADAAKPLKKELNLVDNRLGVLFSERDALEAEAARDGLDAEQRAENGRRLKEIGAHIDALEARWLELSTKLDEIAESVG
jgi:ATP-binding cassette subfamily F protein 3